MAVFGGLAGAGLILMTGEAGAQNILQVGIAYLGGGLIAMALFILTTTLQDDL